MPTPPVWFLDNGQSTGTAVLVTVRPKGGGNAEQRLLTARHVLRLNDKLAGPYSTSMRAWPVDVGYNDGTAVPVEIDLNLTESEAQPVTDPDDLAFLKLPAGRTGATPAGLLPYAQFGPDLGSLDIFGYVSGKDLIDLQQGLVRPAPYREWTFTVPNATAGYALLSSGKGSPAGGVSGGGIFVGERLAGIYRGEVTNVGQHVFMPITRIWDWLGTRHPAWELTDITVAGDIHTITEGLVGIVSLKEEPSVKAKLADARTKIQLLTNVLDQFLICKVLHDHLHNMQRPAQNSLKAAKSDPFDGDRLSSFNTARKEMAELSDEISKTIAKIADQHTVLHASAQAWHTKLAEFLKSARTAGIDKRRKDASKASRDIERLVRVQLVSINEDLVKHVRAMELSVLSGLLRGLAALPQMTAAIIAALEEGGKACDRVRGELEAHMHVHDDWQEMEPLMWDAVMTVSSEDSEGFDLQWEDIEEKLRPLLATHPQVEWTEDLQALINDINATRTSADPWSALPSQFESFCADVRRRFFAVDSDLRLQAQKVATLGQPLELLA
jgi:hypothetical protein